ncbi:uncharacterized protein LOC134841456 isoform X2 [Symsagittifera roscoffensis]|uniref:uncharacterized protein LOC134841456 isoform X2 n=1 Tax=Symsagittifera roscoffensis TaxID=84072 RepID=UPI00307B890B
MVCIENSCESYLYPCSDYIIGNAVLIVYYGITLGYGAKLISDGAEGLLDLGVAPALIGGVILPVSGVVPDSMMILVSGLGDKATAQKQISVGMGTLAGSTVLLLTVVWGVSLVVGRVDLVTSPTCHGLVANSEIRCTGYSLTKQGVEVTKEVTLTAVIMAATTVPYFIIQSSDWYFGATRVGEREPSYVRWAALVTMIISFTGFVAYIVMQFFMASKGANTAPMIKHQKHKEEEIVLRAAKMFYMAPSITLRNSNDNTGSERDEHLLGKKYFAGWRLAAQANRKARDHFQSQNVNVVETAMNGNCEQSQLIGNNIPPEIDDKSGPNWEVLGPAIGRLTFGVALVTIFSDPMCDSLTRITDPKNPQHIPISSFYISFIITPLCSNASELVSSVAFAMRKEKENLVMTYTQLYSAAIMNNTMCLGVFCALVYFRDLEWYFSAEVTSILFTEFLMAALALKCRKIYKLYWAFPVILIYFLSLLLVMFLEKVLKWG